MGDRRTLPPSNLDGAQLEQMRSWVNSGKGAEALSEKSARWRAEEKYMRDLATRVKDRLKRAGAVTESKGNEAMQNAMSPVVLWTEVAADNALAEAERMEEQAQAFSKVQSSVPAASEEKPVPEENFFGQAWAGLTGGKTDNEQALAHNEKLRQDAVTAFKSYDGASQTTISATPTFTSPPEGGVETGTRSGSNPEVGGTGPGTGSGGTGTPAGTRSSWSGTLDPSGSGSGAGTGAAGQSVGRPGAGTAPPAGSHSAWQNPSASGTPGYGQGGTPGASQGSGRVAGGSGVVGGTGRAPGSRIPVRGLGSGAGAGTGSGVGRGAGSGAGRGFGPGGQSGVGRASTAAPTGGATASGSGGARGGAAGAPRGGGQQGEEDEEHETPSYLVGDYGYFDGDLPRVAPPVIGE
ncbi:MULTISPECIES: hypothetical protein [Actinopolyspora]|uniref:PPE family protein n=1 Tax=Actinopolyspora saharensis TaxID=995062 RepID=A0A1H0ZVK9_9ACTN|nr:MULTISPECIES: hypothetical protein [Actinopolyspora]NHD15558.1 hypothetical protein [Actinopolyspora sp. BKK2]NHE75228.1 hypothetical protein [Actinopolyspora sp. BKK1]SDQ31410.1 hypothetical protein SAMN04489718_1263 [Actinopolyspora saharensis]